MASKAEKNKMIEEIKGNQVIDFQEFIDSKFDQLQKFKKEFKRDWNANHEKIEKQLDEKRKQLEVLAEEWLEIAYPTEKNVWKHEYTIQIVISKKAAE